LNGRFQTLKSFHTLNEDYDYVRAIDYSSISNVLYSAADNGIIRQWDVNIGEIMNEYKL
jgi:WD40 repeat protein